MSRLDFKAELMKSVRDCLDRGPGYAQEMVVLRETAERLRITDLDEQQRMLTCWHDLFNSGELSWGYDIDNPNAPFFHLSHRLAG